MRWHVVSHDALAWREWDGELVVFNQETGSTHLLAGLGAEVLRRLMASERGATVAMLTADLADRLARADDAVPKLTIAEILEDFSRLGLARPETP